MLLFLVAENGKIQEGRQKMNQKKVFQIASLDFDKKIGDFRPLPPPQTMFSFKLFVTLLGATLVFVPLAILCWCIAKNTVGYEVVNLSTIAAFGLLVVAMVGALLLIASSNVYEPKVENLIALMPDSLYRFMDTVKVDFGSLRQRANDFDRRLSEYKTSEAVSEGDEDEAETSRFESERQQLAQTIGDLVVRLEIVSHNDDCRIKLLKMASVVSGSPDLSVRERTAVEPLRDRIFAIAGGAGLNRKKVCRLLK